ncbi:hypothetical protein [uncultured Microscilla sp.]|uniref:hypothetical protein n=1 Tax=uncultured Microscilla sp. TaxID=432653 RepID=UPI002611E2E8|nr:hypothetical protein [uncultured Microscilla sp.]
MQKNLRRIFFLGIACLLWQCKTNQAGSKKVKVDIAPKASLKLTFKGSRGSNASSVVYHPDKQMYYSVIAGSYRYPLETFDSQGKSIYQARAGMSTRGMWWNPQTKQLERNVKKGIAATQLSQDGYATSDDLKVILKADLHQPNGNSCGVYDPDADEILYYSYEKIYRYSRKDAQLISSYYLIGLPTDGDNLNANSMIYTSKPGMEIGLLDYKNKKVHLFDKKTHKFANTIDLPENTVTSKEYRFGYANDYVWLFDIGERSWVGYKIFK